MRSALRWLTCAALIFALLVVGQLADVARASGGGTIYPNPHSVPSLSTLTASFDAHDYGAKGNGVADDKAAFTRAATAAAAGSGGTLYLRAGTYYFGSTLSWTWSNVRVVGVGNVTITSPSIQVINFSSSGAIQNVSFVGIKFVSTFAQTSDPVLGVITAQSQAGNDFSIDNLQFVDIEVTAPTGGAGIKLVPQSPTNKQFTNVTIARAYLHDLGREGITVQNHGPGNVWDGVTRYQNVVVRDSRIVNVGLNGYTGTGIGVSIDGAGLNVSTSNSLFDNCEKVGIEYVNTAGGLQILNNRFRTFNVRNGVPYDPISIDTAQSITGASVVVAGNQEIDTPPNSAVAWNFYKVDRAIVSNNVTRGMGFVVNNTTNSIFSGNNVNSTNSYAIYVTGTSSGNKFVGNRLDTTAASSPFSVIRYDGVGVTNNEAVNNDIVYSSGVATDQINSAANNYTGTNRVNNTETIDSAIATLTGAQTLTNKTLTTPVLAGLTASGSAAIDFTGSSGAFKFPTGGIQGGIVNSSTSRVHAVQVADANYTRLSTDFQIEYTTLTAARTITTSPANGTAALPIQFVVKDKSGSASSTNTITISMSSGLIDGASTKVCINSAYGSCRLFCDGTNCYTW